MSYYLNNVSLGIFLQMFFHLPLVFLHLLCYHFSSQKAIINQDLKNFKQWPALINKNSHFISLWAVLVMSKEFRNVFYMRLGRGYIFLSYLLPPLKDVMLGYNTHIDGGFCLIHGFGTVINDSVKIGQNCIVLHGVTIGEDWKGGIPTLGDNVFVGCHAQIIGNVNIGNNVKVGAGAIVVTDIPDNSTVVGFKSKIISHNE